MQAEEVAYRSRLSAATRYESLVGVSNAVGTHRDPQLLFGALVKELHRVVRLIVSVCPSVKRNRIRFTGILSTRKQKPLSFQTQN